MKPYIVRGTIKQLRHSLLRTPHRFVMVHNLHTILLPINLKDQELRRAISYLKLPCHCILEITLIYKFHSGLLIKNPFSNSFPNYVKHCLCSIFNDLSSPFHIIWDARNSFQMLAKLATFKQFYRIRIKLYP